MNLAFGSLLFPRSPSKQLKGMRKHGERGRNRTFNLLIKSQLLCQLSYAPAAAERPNNNLGGTREEYASTTSADALS